MSDSSPVTMQEVTVRPGTFDQNSPIAADHAAVIVSLLEGLPGGGAFLDRDLRYAYANRNFLDFFDGDEKRLIGKHASEIYGAQVYTQLEAIAERCFAGETVHIEGQSMLRGGDTWVSQTFTPYLTPDQGILGIMIRGIDMTRQKQEERYHLESEALHRAIVATSLDSLIIVDGEGKVVDFNPAAEKLFGYSRAEAVGSDIGSLIIPDHHRAAHAAGMNRYMLTGETRVIGKRVELEAKTKSGAIVPVELALADVSVGTKRFFTAHIRDLQPTKAAQFEIERQRDALFQKEKLAALGSLLSGVAHELNNPLSIVIGQAMMLREKSGGGELAERAEKIETAANRCAKIVKTFLAMARQRKTERTDVSIARVIGDAVELLNYGLRTSDVALGVEIEGELPPTRADGDLLHQVLVNLIVNARQALEECPGSDRRINIRAGHDAATNVISIRVEDNGPGIPANIRNRIFDPFFTTKPQDHGTGVGLAVSRGLVESHGGTLELADPQPAKGAAFVIRLPVLRDETDGEGPARPEAAAAPVAAPKSTLLIVDDEPEIAELISDMVMAMGLDVKTARSGREAQRVLGEAGADFEAILCDIRMPDGDGPGLYDWLSANRPKMTSRIGFVTGDTLGPSAGRFLARTGCPVIEKPFTPADIAAVVKSLIG